MPRPQALRARPMARTTIQAEYPSAVPPAKALQWFFDFTTGDHSDPRFQALWGKPKPGDGRTMVSKKGDEAVFEDRFGGRLTRFTARREGHSIVSKGQGQGYTSEGRLSFEPHGQGSLIREHLTMEGGAMMGLMVKLMGIPGKIEKDVGIHVAMMDEEWKRKPW